MGGWQVNGIANFRTGMPYTIVTANDIANVSTGGQRANATGVSPANSTRARTICLDLIRPHTPRPLGDSMAISPATHSRVSAPTTGTSPQSRTSRSAQLGEQSRLQLRFEWFNVFNHTQFFNPAATQNVPSQFGIVTAASDPRILQIGAKLYW